MKIVILSLGFIFNVFVLSAQDYTIAGKIMDFSNAEPLSSATVFAESLKDSTLLNYTISDKLGNFEIQIKSNEKRLRLNISFTGMKSYNEVIELNSNSIQLDDIQLKELASNLDEVVVNVNRSPITIKRDTLEFNASSFKTRPDANLEDTLKQLPGVEVDVAGNITVNGKPVQRILVNGKEFFGNDPKIATKNLP